LTSAPSRRQAPPRQPAAAPRAWRRIAEIAAATCGLVCLAAAIASLGGPIDPKLDLASHFAPAWFAGGVLVVLLAPAATSVARRRAIAGLGLCSALGAAPPIVPELARPIRPNVPAAADYVIKIVEYNAWVDNPRTRTDADWLAAQHPDFVMMTDAEAPIVDALRARGFEYRKGVADTAIFSRASRIPEAYGIPPLEWPRLPSFARATFLGPDGPFTLIATHLPRPTARSEEGEEDAIVRLAARYDRRRLIVAGDFNATPWSFALRRLDRAIGLERRDRALFSWPAVAAPWPFLPIDHLYAGSSWRTVSIARGPRLGSDHYPIVAVLALTSPGTSMRGQTR
jgi:endonuclease/exonuclease/phosphatase (EEP) superfamily protein YafD